MTWMLKDSSGVPSATLTMTIVSFAIVTLNVVLNMFSDIQLGSFHVTPKPIDMTTLGLYFGLAGTGYIVRRKHSLGTEAEEEPEEVEKK